MAVKQDEERKLEDDPLKHLDALEPSRLQELAEQIAPQVAPPAAALLPKQTEPTREQAKELLSYWVEEGDVDVSSGIKEILRQEAEEREGRTRDQRNSDEGGAGGHTDDGRAGMTQDFVADSEFVGGALADRGGGGGPQGPKDFGGDGSDGDGGGAGGGDKPGKPRGGGGAE